MLLRRRLLLLFVGIVAAVLVLGAFTVIRLRDRDDAQERARGLSLAVERIAQLTTAAADQESGVRGFVITGQGSFLAPYTQGRAASERLVGTLRATLDTPALRRDLAAVATTIATWQRRSAEPAIALTRSVGPQAAASAIDDAGGQQLGQQLFDSVRRAQDTLARDVEAAADGARRRLDELRSTLTWLFLSMVVVAVVGAALASWLIRRWVTRPIAVLAGEVRRVRAGALDSPIRVTGPPELASLALDVDAMRGRIRQQLDESERSRETLEQSAAVVLTLRSELETVLGDVPDGWSMAARLRAAEGVVAGDCFDLFMTRGGGLALVVVDIAGHGATEGILALRCKEMLRTALVSGSEPGRALDTTAEILGDMGEEVFLTAFVAVIDPTDGRVRYANAGHPPAYVVTDGALASLDPTGPLVGLLTPGWATAEAVVERGATLCAYTDGMIETRNAQHDLFGPDRLVALLERSRCDEAEAVVKRCIDEVEQFSPDGLHDDATIVVLCRTQ